jgi:hypothetical protein
MTSPDRVVRERGRRWAPLLIGLGALAAQLTCLSASAEGSFFKDRQNAPMPQQKPAAPAAPAPVVPPHANASADTAGDTEGQPGRGPDAPSQPAPAKQAAPPVVSAAPQVSASVPASPTVPPSPTVQSPARPASSRTDVSGAVTEVLTTDTFVVAGQQIQLAGVRGRAMMLTGLRGWIANNGNQLNCRAVGPRYRCSTPNGKDVGQIVLANGAGEADANAPPEYRSAETQARLGHKGIWNGR